VGYRCERVLVGTGWLFCCLRAGLLVQRESVVAEQDGRFGMAKRDKRRARRRLRSTFLVPLVMGLLFWWWRRHTESQRSGSDDRVPGSIRLEPAMEETEDLTRISGIGPKVSQLLLAAGIATFAQLAAADVDNLRRILRDAGLTMIDPGTWPEQANLVATGQWDELEALDCQA